MKEDNNPFRPTLSKPVDDSVLATDPHADNFLAGNDRLAHQQRVTMDVVNNAAGAPHLDQMNMSGADTPAVGQPADVTTALNDMSNVSTAEPGGVMAGATGPTVQPTASIFDGLSDGKKGKKKNKKHLLGRKKKAAEVKPTPASPAAAAESVFGSSLDFGKTDSAHSQHDTTTTAGSANSITSSLNSTHNTDVLTHAGATGAPDAKPADAAGDLLGNLGNLGSAADLTNGGNTDSHDKADDAPSPIGASLAAAAAAADGKTGGVEITPAKDVGKTKAAKNGQPKQLTVSVLTIIFFVLFIGAGAAAVYFGIQNNKNVNALGDAQAELQQLKDQNADSSNSANKESTQFDALQDRIKELTTDNDNKQKTIDENKTTIDNLNKQVTDLTKQVTDANNKLTSDTTVSDKMQSLITTLCAAGEPYSNSSVCIDANGGNAGAVQPTPQQ